MLTAWQTTQSFHLCVGVFCSPGLHIKTHRRDLAYFWKTCFSSPLHLTFLLYNVRVHPRVLAGTHRFRPLWEHNWRHPPTWYLIPWQCHFQSWFCACCTPLAAPLFLQGENWGFWQGVPYHCIRWNCKSCPRHQPLCCRESQLWSWWKHGMHYFCYAYETILPIIV